jgi:hypothetical protein
MKKYTAVVNVEHLEATPFLVVNLYDKYLSDQIIAPYESPSQAIECMKDLMAQHDCSVFCLTSNRDIYALTLNTPGINGMIKHYEDTKETASSLKVAEDVLRDLYDITPIEPLPQLPKWRKRLFYSFLIIANKLGGNGHYEI